MEGGGGNEREEMKMPEVTKKELLCYTCSHLYTRGRGDYFYRCQCCGTKSKKDLLLTMKSYCKYYERKQLCHAY